MLITRVYFSCQESQNSDEIVYAVCYIVQACSAHTLYFHQIRCPRELYQLASKCTGASAKVTMCSKRYSTTTAMKLQG